MTGQIVKFVVRKLLPNRKRSDGHNRPGETAPSVRSIAGQRSPSPFAMPTAFLTFWPGCTVTRQRPAKIDEVRRPFGERL
jgi:hypothetical protein